MSEDHATDLGEVVDETVDETEEIKETTDVVEDDLEPEGDEPEGEEEEEPEVEEFMFGGDRLEVPKGSIPDDIAAKIKDFTEGTWKDYQSKSRANAETAKSLEAEKSAVERIKTMTTESLTKFGKALSLQDEIAQLQGTDLSQLWQSDDPADRDKARQVSDYVSGKQAELQNITADISRSEAELTKVQAEETQRKTDEGKQIVERHIKGFDASAVVKHAIDLGIPEVDANNWALNPTVAIMAHESMMFRKMQANAKKPAPKKQAEPVKPMKAKGSTKRAFDPVRDADNIPMDEWVRRENARLRKKA